jgi:hypothetical protein
MLVSKTYRNICLYVFGTQRVMLKVTLNRTKLNYHHINKEHLTTESCTKNLFVNTKFSSLRSKHSQKAYHTHRSIISPLWTQGVCGSCTGLTCQWGRSRMVDFLTRQQSRRVMQQQAQWGGVLVPHGKGSDLFLEVVVFWGPVGTARCGWSWWYVSARPRPLVKWPRTACSYPLLCPFRRLGFFPKPTCAQNH